VTAHGDELASHRARRLLAELVDDGTRGRRALRRQKRPPRINKMFCDPALRRAAAAVR